MSKIIIAVLAMALVTYIPRVLPLALFNKQIKSKFIKSFLYYVPYAVLGAMTFPYILYSTGSVTSASIGLLAAIFLSFLNQGLLKVAMGSIVIVFIVEFFSAGNLPF